MIYVIKNINGDIIGVADNEDSAIEIYLERYSFEDNYAYNLATSDQIEYLMSLGNPRIETYELNKFYYQ